MRKAKDTRIEPGGSARRRLTAITLVAAVGLGASAVFAQQGEQPAPAPQQQAPQSQAAPQQGTPGQAPPAESKPSRRSRRRRPDGGLGRCGL